MMKVTVTRNTHTHNTHTHNKAHIHVQATRGSREVDSKHAIRSAKKNSRALSPEVKLSVWGVCIKSKEK